MPRLNRWKMLAAAFLLFTAAIATYAPALRDGFVWDDQALILRDPFIRSWRLIGEGFEHFLFTDAAASNFYRPLQRLSYTFDYAAFFLSSAGYHLVSILWHAAAGIAFFCFAQELLESCAIEERRRFRIAFFAALIWIVHPVQSSAVIYISGRADPLAAAFGFCGLYLSLRMLRVSGNPRWLFGIGSGICFLASALSKESGLIFLGALLIIAMSQAKRRQWLATLGIIVAVVTAYTSLRLPAERLAPPPPADVPLVVRPILTARALAEYAGLVVLPLRLHMERDVASYPSGFTPASLDTTARRELQTLLGAALIVAAIFAMYRARRSRSVFIPLLLAVVSYLPMSGIFSLNATVAEHWIYVPSAFLFLGVVTLLASSRRSSALSLGHSLGRKALLVCATLWMVFLPVRSFIRCFDWKDQRTFLTRTIADRGDSARMLINLGNLELSEGNLGAARANLERALKKEPRNPLAQLNLAIVKTRQRDFAGARTLLKQISAPPELQARAAEALAVVENRETGTINLRQLHLATRIGPPAWSIEEHYVKALTDLGLFDAALNELKSCLVIAPYRAETWLMMSEVLRRAGRTDAAAIAFEEAQSADVHLLRRTAAR
jgi:tetratricopeptide (TPR) repeat protein